MVLGALVPSYNCLVKDNGWFVAGSVVGTIASIALSGGAGAVVAVGRMAAGVAVKLAVSGARRLVTAGIERTVGAAVRRAASAVASRTSREAAITINFSTAGRTAEEASSGMEYARRSNQYLTKAGPQRIIGTSGELRSEATAAARAERALGARGQSVLRAGRSCA
ncbi:MAG: hypothetical protein JWN70_1383 [Planctomycetaceae bacterium]|nr:hypothetical protein [Planctomycetaceae bacterium]